MLDFGLDLGPHVSVVALDVDTAACPARGTMRRKLEFSAGRRAAALALSRLGTDTLVSRAADGRPLWPPGVVGSISHGANLAVAAVGRDHTHAGIGIDIEAVLEPEIGAEVRRSVASHQELALLTRALPTLSDETLLTLAFSCKESLYKCLFPQTMRFMEFDDARVIATAPELTATTISFQLERELGKFHPRGARFEARFCITQGTVRTAVADEKGTRGRRG